MAAFGSVGRAPLMGVFSRAGLGAVFRQERGAGGGAQRDSLGAAAGHLSAALGGDRQGSPQVLGKVTAEVHKV